MSVKRVIFPFDFKILDSVSIERLGQEAFFKGIKKNIFKSSFLFILLFILCFTFFQWMINRQRVYLYYSFYIFALLLFYLNRTGYVYGITLTSVRAYSEVLSRITVIGAIISYFLFVTSFLGLTRKLHPRLIRIMQVGIVIFILVTFYYILNLYAGNLNFAFSSYIYLRDILLLGFGGAVTYYVYRLKTPLSKFILYGSYTLLTMAAIASFNEHLIRVTGKDIEFYGASYVQYGILLELIIFSTGLGYRSKLLQQEKNTTQQSLIQQLEQNQSLQTELNLKLQIEKEKLDIENQLTLVELRLLKAQINPHFLFNSFNALKDLIHQNKNGEAIQYLGKFTRMMRGVLSSSEIQQHSLKDELAFCENYVALESVRFAKDLNLSVQASEESMTTMVPTMVLQPILENAIWHGLLPSKDDRNITINSKIIDQKLIIHILDNGVGLKSSDIISIKENGYTSFGLRLVIDRLKYFAKDSTLAISDRLDTDLKSIGTIVAIEIPINNYSPSKTSNS